MILASMFMFISLINPMAVSKLQIVVKKVLKRGNYSFNPLITGRVSEGTPRQIVLLNQNHRVFSNVVSCLFSLHSYGSFDTKFIEIGHSTRELLDFSWSKVKPKFEIFVILCTKPMAKSGFLFYSINHR